MQTLTNTNTGNLPSVLDLQWEPNLCQLLMLFVYEPIIKGSIYKIQIQTLGMSHPSWIFNESPIFASSFSQRAPRRQHGDELSSLNFLLCTFPLHTMSSIYTFPKKINSQELQAPKNRGRKGALQALMILVLLLSCLFVERKKTWKFDCGVQRSRKVADWAFTRLSEDFKRVLDVSPRKCQKPVHWCFHRFVIQTTTHYG